MMQELLESAVPAAAGLPGSQQLADVGAIPCLVSVKGSQRCQLPVHRRRAHVRFHRRQHRHRAISPSWRQRQPGHVLAQVLQPHHSPVYSRRARNTQKSFRSWAYAFTVFGDRSMSVR